MSSRTRERRRLSIRYFDDRIVLTDTHAWAYYRIPTVPYEFTTPEERAALATNMTIALAAIRMPDAEVHLRIVHRSYPAAEWARRLDSTSDGGAGWLDYLDEMYRHVWAKDFWGKEVYLGVRLGQRSMRVQLSGGVFAQFISLYQRSEKALGLDDEAVDEGEIAKWTELSRAARPRARGERARRTVRDVRRDRLAIQAHPVGLDRRPATLCHSAPYLGLGRDRRPTRRSGAQRADLTATGALCRRIFCRVPIVLPFPGRDGIP